MDTYLLGQPVPLSFSTYGTDGVLAAPTSAVLTVTRPDGSTTLPALTVDDAGSTFTVDFVPAMTGRHVAAFVSTGAAAGAAVDVFDVLSATASVVTVADVRAYLGADTSATDAELGGALDAERSAQADVCRVDDFTPALREALLRRVARNLAARSVPVASFSAFEGGGGEVRRVPQRDPEVARLEAPYRRLVVG
jgi:hypothetical protein